MTEFFKGLPLSFGAVLASEEHQPALLSIRLYFRVPRHPGGHDLACILGEAGDIQIVLRIVALVSLCVSIWRVTVAAIY